MAVPNDVSASMCVTGPDGVVMTFSWDWRLVALSVAIAIAGSFAALECAGRMRVVSPNETRHHGISVLGAILMGLAIWSMHFVGMMALQMPMPVSYAPGWSFLSVVAAAVGAGVAFAVMNQPRVGAFHILTGGLAMGLAIVAMHYLGMKSMQMGAVINYEPLRFTASLVIAVVASAGALTLGYAMPRTTGGAYWLKTGSAIVMGVAIAGMHYEGMASARYRLATIATQARSDPMVGTLPLRDVLSLASLVFAAALVALAMRAAVDRQRAVEAYQQLAAELEERVRQRTAELEATNRDLSAFSYTVSHDLRSPLRTIIGFSDLIGETAATTALPDDIKGYLARIHNAATRMDALLTGLLHMANISRATLVRSDVDASQLARSIVADFAAQEPQRVVEVDVADGLRVTADATLLTSVLQNLLHNAWKFTARANPARITVGSETRDSGRVFFVRDNGAGFDMAHAAKLFGMFERLHHTNEFPGHGIGLAVTKRILERHGGRVWVESVRGVGTTFWFTVGAS